MNSLELLKKYWGYESFRPLQQEVIDQVMSGNDTLALLATGAGKSICFQIPALLHDGVTLVISPLVALMKDQVEQLKAKGIAAEAIYSGMSYKTVDRILDNAVYGGIKLLYLSPERLASDMAIARIRLMQIRLIAVDEAHCISLWGYDFRPSYLRIAELRQWHPEASVLAVTATATKIVAEDIQNHLQFRSKHVLKSSFARPNISFEFKQVEVKESTLLNVLSKNPGSTIIYVNSRKKAKRTSDFLIRNGFTSSFYHAGLDPQTRSLRQANWTSNQIPIIVSTNAFGMGIDKADVRNVVHLDIPRSIEAYYQEAGRAGRDGNPSKAILLYYHDDPQNLLEQIERSHPPLATVRKIYQSIGNYLKLASGSGALESFDFDIVEFANRMGYDVFETHHCIQILERAEFLSLSEQNWKPSTVRFIASNRSLITYIKTNPTIEPLIKVLLRNYQNIGMEHTFINEGSIARQVNIATSKVRKILTLLDKENVVEYIPRSESAQITFLKARLSNDQLSFIHLNYKALKAAKMKSAQAMISLLSNNSCRQHAILQYFDQKLNEPCRRCDNCRRYQSSSSNDIQSVIDSITSLPPETILEDDVDADAMTFLLEKGVIYRFGHQYKRR